MQYCTTRNLPLSVIVSLAILAPTPKKIDNTSYQAFDKKKRNAFKLTAMLISDMDIIGFYLVTSLHID
jgi:hypothetical protein